MNKIKSVLFVCAGNICRSPMAEYLLKDYARQGMGLRISSAGITAVDNMPASESAVQAMREINMDISRHRSRMLMPRMVEENDIIITMTESQKSILTSMFPSAARKIFRLTFFDKKGKQGDIADPIGASLDTYRITRDQIKESLLDLILHLKKCGRHAPDCRRGLDA